VCIGRGQVLRIQECARELKPLRFTAVSLAHARGPQPLLEGGNEERLGFRPQSSRLSLDSGGGRPSKCALC
jgi:hypothetical protein